MSLLILLVAGLAVCAVGMALAWLTATRIDNYGIVDIAWAGSLSVLSVLYASLSHQVPLRAAPVVVMACAWSLRLAIYLYRRVIGLHPTEDSRYQDLRRSWGRRIKFRMFWFFQAQGVAAVFFSLPFALALGNANPHLHPAEWLGTGIWALGMAGESTADWQLAAFKTDPANRGRICDIGLWKFSRHPNYFFEWVIWCGFAVLALPAPWGALALACPAAMLWLLLGLTGIPATESAALARRGESYRQYQRTTSAFVPWFPSKG